MRERQTGASYPAVRDTDVYSEKIPIPPLDEQRKIAAVLSLVQRAIEQQERLIALTGELKRALMHKLFTEGLHGEPQKQTEIGPIPESWEIDRLGNVAALKSGGTPSRRTAEYWEGGTIPWVKTGEINYARILDTEEHITKSALANSAATIFPPGTLLMAMYGQGVTRGRVALLGVDAATNQACVAIILKPHVDTSYLYHFFTYHYEDLRRHGHGANQSNLSGEILKIICVSYPADLGIQQAIAEAIDAIDYKRAMQEDRRTLLQELFRTLLHQLMTAQIRVHELDLSGLADVSPLESLANTRMASPSLAVDEPPSNGATDRPAAGTGEAARMEAG